MSSLKKEECFNRFSDNCGYSLLLHPKEVTGSFLKISLDVKSEALQMNFSHVLH